MYTKYLLLFTLIITASCGNENITIDKPNIILIVADDLGYKDLACMGSHYYETPNLDRLASEGLLFDNAYASASNCAPSRACMISGMHSPRHGIYTVSPSARGKAESRKLIPVPNTNHLDTSFYTLHRMMKNAGYVTSNFGKWHLGNNPAEQGVDVNVGGSTRGNPGHSGYFSPYNIDFIDDGPTGEYLTDRLTDEAMKFIDTYQDTSFFLYLPYYTVHTPIMGKEKLIEHFKEKTGSQGQNNPAYAAMISSLDENMGRLLTHLEEKGASENTLIIFTSDNGGVLSISSQEPLRAGKGSYYEGGIKVPLLVKWPGKITPGTTNSTRVSNLDFYPTLQEIVQPMLKNDSLDGISILPLCTGGEINHPPLYYHFPIYLQSAGAIRGLPDPLFRTRPGSVIIDGDWKLHHYYEDDRTELYNLKNDPSEMNNVWADSLEAGQNMMLKLQSWIEDYQAPIPTETNPAYDEEMEKSLVNKLLAKK